MIFSQARRLRARRGPPPGEPAGGSSTSPPPLPTSPSNMSFATRTLRPVARTLAQAGPAPVQVRNMATLREIEMRSVLSPRLPRRPFALAGRPSWKELGPPPGCILGGRKGSGRLAASRPR
jgi:hypothetical protein